MSHAISVKTCKKIYNDLKKFAVQQFKFLKIFTNKAVIKQDFLIKIIILDRESLLQRKRFESGFHNRIGIKIKRLKAIFFFRS